MDSLDRPYGDSEHEYLTVHPEAPQLPPEPHTGDIVADEEAAAAAEARAIGGVPSDDGLHTNDVDERWPAAATRRGSSSPRACSSSTPSRLRSPT
jgi:hypothetical protein